ncbi:MAG: SDR family NAD(P)-dependent oxidoreductase, partial [Nitrosopumilus sp.]|nr:SDR family NAD(P)-dependent oxidoreductase [Nitrosopumilus sp.]
MHFKDKVVLITGASSGIGQASAVQFAKKGAKLILVSRKQEKLIKVEKDLEKFNVSTFVCECDVSDKTQVKRMSETVLEKYESVDILVNN